MRTTFFFHNMKNSPRLQKNANEKFSRVADTFVSKCVELRASFDFQCPTYKVSCHVFGGDGFDIHLSDADENPYIAIDRVAEKMYRVLRKKKERLKAHRARKVTKPLIEEQIEGLGVPQKILEVDEREWLERSFY